MALDPQNNVPRKETVPRHGAVALEARAGSTRPADAASAQAEVRPATHDMTLRPTPHDLSLAAESHREATNPPDPDFESALMEGLSEPVSASSADAGWADLPDLPSPPTVPAEPDVGDGEPATDETGTDLESMLLDERPCSPRNF